MRRDSSVTLRREPTQSLVDCVAEVRTPHCIGPVTAFRERRDSRNSVVCLGLSRGCGQIQGRVKTDLSPTTLDCATASLAQRSAATLRAPELPWDFNSVVAPPDSCNDGGQNVEDVIAWGDHVVFSGTVMQIQIPRSIRTAHPSLQPLGDVAHRSEVAGSESNGDGCHPLTLDQIRDAVCDESICG